MTGTYEHTIDAKGRMFLPSRLREELGHSFHIAVGANRDSAGICKYLVMYPEAAWQKLQERVAELPSSQASAMDVVVIGNNDKAKLWDAEAWNAKKRRELTPEQVAETMLLLGL